jgi:phosphatidylglycerol---prolipoprotein diacylglyceryl transferase
MLPVLFTIGKQSISSFGLFLLLAFIAGAFVIWRLIKIYELDEEKTIDLIILTSVGGLIFARVYFILFHLTDFNTWDKILLINKYPGLSFWGAIIGSILTLKLFSHKMKINFYQAADIGIIGVFTGLILSSIGCLLGSCEYGQISNLPVAVNQIGLIGQRFPLQIISAVLCLIFAIYLWRQSLRFHFNGQILAKGLILLGLMKFSLEFYRGDRQIIWNGLSLGFLWSLLLVVLGIKIYYHQSRKSFVADLKYALSIFYKANRRRNFVLKLSRELYNFRVNLKFAISKRHKKVLKDLNVKTTPPQI